MLVRSGTDFLRFFFPWTREILLHSLRLIEKRLKVLGSEMESVAQVRFWDNPAPMKIFARSYKTRYCDKASATERAFW